METTRISYLAAATLLLAVANYAVADTGQPTDTVTASSAVTSANQSGAAATLTPQENLRDWVKGIKPAAGPGRQEEKGSSHYSTQTVYRNFKE